MAVHNVLQLIQEPFVDLGKVMHLVHGIVLMQHSLANSQPSPICRIAKYIIQIIKLITLESNVFRVYLTDSFLNGLLKGPADSHDLANRFH